jgi:putative tryptophan/tyrosine transport system substrate-binding protein
MKRYITGSVILTIALAIAVFVARKYPTRPSESVLRTVAITQIATEPALDEVRTGIISGLLKRGFVDKQNIRILFENANGDASLSLPIAQQFVRLPASVIVPISTPSALAVASSTKVIPIVFSGVSDPVGIHLVADMTRPGGNITGVSDQWPYELQIRTFLEIFPNVKTIGMLYTRGDDVSSIGTAAVGALAPKLNFRLQLVPISAAQDVYPAAVSLLQSVDAIYTGIDHLLLENMDGLVKAAREANKPLFGGESGSVEKGAVLAVSINMSHFGDLTSGLIVKVLNGANPEDLPIEVVTEGDLIVNAPSAKHFGLNLESLKKRGAKIIGQE